MWRQHMTKFALVVSGWREFVSSMTMRKYLTNNCWMPFLRHKNLNLDQGNMHP